MYRMKHTIMETAVFSYFHALAIELKIGYLHKFTRNLKIFLTNLKEPLEKQAALVYNLAKKVIGIEFPIALSESIYFEIASTLGGGMLFLFTIIYVRQCRKYY